MEKNTLYWKFFRYKSHISGSTPFSIKIIKSPSSRVEIEQTPFPFVPFPFRNNSPHPTPTPTHDLKLKTCAHLVAVSINPSELSLRPLARLSHLSQSLCLCLGSPFVFLYLDVPTLERIHRLEQTSGWRFARPRNFCFAARGSLVTDKTSRTAPGLGIVQPCTENQQGKRTENPTQNGLQENQRLLTPNP